MVRRNIIQRIEELTEGEGTCVFKLSDVTDFKWDQVVYFEYPVSAAEISRSAGINYKRSTDLLEGYIYLPGKGGLGRCGRHSARECGQSISGL